MTAQQLFDCLRFVSENGFDLCELTVSATCFSTDFEGLNDRTVSFNIETVGVKENKLFLFDKDSNFL